MADETKKKSAPKKESKPEVKDIKIELNGIEDRVERLTINSSDLADYVITPDGEKLYYLAAFEGGYDLWVNELRKNEPKLRELIASYAGHIILRQGENGAPSMPGSFGAIAKYEWTEVRQAKWALRRLLGDLGRDIPSSYFSICDMRYPDRVNYKGLLAINDDKSVNHPKHSYFAVQRIMSVFDNTVHRIREFAGTVEGGAQDASFSLFGYRTDGGANIATLWRDSQRPGERPDLERVTVTLPGMKFARPVWVDLLSGSVYEISGSLVTKKDGAVVIGQVPVYDSVVLIAERDAIPLVP